MKILWNSVYGLGIAFDLISVVDDWDDKFDYVDTTPQRTWMTVHTQCNVKIFLINLMIGFSFPVGSVKTIYLHE